VRPGGVARALSLPVMLLVTTVSQREVVARCCGQARAQGVVPGMPVAEARALCPAPLRVRVSPFEPERSRQGIAMLAKWSLRFSPTVMVDPSASGFYEDDTPDGLLLDVTGEAHLFGGEHLLLADVAARIAWLGFSTRLAIAPTAGAAWAVARYGPHPLSVLDEDHLQTALSPLPVAALRLPRETCEKLAQVGIGRIGELVRLPRESLLTRYEEELLLRLDQAFGRVSEGIEGLHPAEPVTVRRVFEGATVQLEALFLAMQGLLEELSGELLEKENGVRGLRVEWMRINAPAVSREIFLGRPTRDAKHLWSLLRPKVEGLHLGYGVEAVAITAFWTERIRHRQLGVWETGDPADTHDEEYAAFLDTLMNRWRKPNGGWDGGRVMTAKPVASHMPEVARAFELMIDKRHDEAGAKHEIRMTKDESSSKVRMTKSSKRMPEEHGFEYSNFSHSELIRHSSSVIRASPVPMLFLDRPTTLLEQPESAQALALQPDHPPGVLVWRGREHIVAKGVGPERIATAWWGQHTLSTRDYFRLETTAGVWLWVFREVESGQWFVHGMWS
jgi:protein ImuB